MNIIIEITKETLSLPVSLNDGFLPRRDMA